MTIDATFWVAVAFVLFVALCIYMGLHRSIIDAITSACSFIQMCRKFIFPSLHDISGIGKGRHIFTGGLLRSISAGVIPMKMRVNDDVDIIL